MATVKQCDWCKRIINTVCVEVQNESPHNGDISLDKEDICMECLQKKGITIQVVFDEHKP